MSTFEEGDIVGFEFDGEHLNGRIVFISGEGDNTEYVIKDLLTPSMYRLYAEHLTKTEQPSTYVDPTRMGRIPLHSTTVNNPKPLCDCGAIHTSFPNDHFGWCVAMKGARA